MSTPAPRRISVIGTGYLGATHAACLAELGHEVLGVDSDPEKVGLLAAGLLPFREPGLDELVARHVATGRLRFTTDLRQAAAVADLHFVCVGTPQARGSGEADLTALHAVVDELARHLRRDALVVGKSTVPVGTAARLECRLAARARAGVRLSVAWNPEFLREGHAVADTLHPDRLVLGVTDSVSEAALRAVYAPLVEAGVPVHVTDPATAELAKTAANAFLAMKISFANAMAELSDLSGADVVALADVLGDDGRIGRRFLDAGVGFGGGCLPKDVRALGARAASLGADTVTALLAQVDLINLHTRERVVAAAADLCEGRVTARRIGVLGASFKPLSDDVRDSPALHVAEALHQRGADVRVYDPQGSVNARAVCPELTYVASTEAALTDADVVLHLTDWPEFAAIDPVWAAGLVRRRRIVDARNRLAAAHWRAAGWRLRGIGRGETPPLPADTAGALLGQP